MKFLHIFRFGGKAGADILREHAIETRDILETSITEAKDKSVNNANRLNNESSDNAAANISDTMEQLNQLPRQQWAEYFDGPTGTWVGFRFGAAHILLQSPSSL